MDRIESVDPLLSELIRAELKRENETIQLIASENFASEAILQAQGSLLTNKYAEGYPRRRHYGGCEHVDSVEELAIQRAKSLFGAEHANVQPHCGTGANLAVYLAVLKPGDKVMAMDLTQGGHLSHGSPVSITGQLYDFIHYGVSRETETIDYDEVRSLARRTRPKLIVAGASAYPRIMDFAQFQSIAAEVGAELMVDIAHIAGLIAGGAHPNPVPHASFVTSTTHKTLAGPRAGFILCKSEFAKAIDRAVFPGLQGGPMMHSIAAKALCFATAMTEEFKEYSRQIVKNAQAAAETLRQLGYRLVSGGTDTHLILVDLRNKGLTGKEAEEILDGVGITLNKNVIPFDPQKPTVTSGIRLGTPAMTARGFKEDEFRLTVEFIDRALAGRDRPRIEEEIRKETKTLCEKFPIYFNSVEPIFA